MSETVVMPPGLPSHVRPGLVIAGKYRLEEEIGRGSMGTVYRAVHVTLGQRVAIKLISSEHLQSSEARHRFSVEAKAAARLRSRHVVQVHDDGETPEGNPYIVLEYLEGETLEQRLQREHDVPLADAVRITTHVGRALARAHAHGIVHRDLKPANVFLVKTEDDERGFIAKVLDFGIAKLEAPGEKSTTVAGTVLGTPLFMSPEQVRGASSVDHRADLYSLGMCLYNMLTGEYAYYSANYGDILISICTQPLPKLRALAPWVPESVELWFQRACAKDPLDRFQSADEMTEALAAASGNGGAWKHQSVPEGRIAPETLMGFAPPSLPAQGPRGELARTQAAALPANAGPVVGPHGTAGFGDQQSSSGRAPAPVSIAISGRNQSAGLESEATWRPPSRAFAPLVIGAGVGFSLLGVLALGLHLRGRPDAVQASPEGAPPQAIPSELSRSAGPPSAAVTVPAPPPTDDASSSVTAAPATSGTVGVSTVAIGSGPKPAAPSGKRPVPRPEPAATTAKSPGSDLGF